MPLRPFLSALAARPIRLLPLVVALFFLYYVFFSAPSHSHTRIFPNQVPSLQYLAYHGQENNAQPRLSSPRLQSHKQHPVVDTSDCPNLQGIDDVYVIMKTGASEAHRKLPIHFSTTLKCIPDYVIYSDFDDVVAGHKVHDSLDEVNRLIATQNHEFDLYRRLKKDGKVAIGPDDTGRDSAGWKLDKWKFLPIMEKVWRDRPMASWYVFIEDDTYMSWPNLLYYIQKLQPTDAHYIGAQMQIEKVIFAHGGSGFVLSNEALRLGVQKRRGNIEYYDGYTASHWAGDCVLGQLMDDVDTPVHWAWPNFQGQTPATLGANSAGYEGSVWCNAAITFHHMSPNEIEQMWRFERKLEKHSGRDPLTHSTVFRELVLPEIRRLGPEADEWDNASEGQQVNLETLTTAPSVIDAVGHCRALCERTPECVQYRAANGTCTISPTVALGAAAPPVADAAAGSVRSGWLLDRVDRAVLELSRCEPDARIWVLPESKAAALEPEAPPAPAPDPPAG